jgi:hypothetical protein
MTYNRIVNVGQTLGVILSIAGLFFPWGQLYYLGVYGIPGPDFLGIQLPIGQLTFHFCIFSAIFLILHRKRKLKHSLFLIFLCGLLTMFSTLLWVIRPGITMDTWYVYYRPLYGVYITLIGAALILESTCFSLYFMPSRQNAPSAS